MKITLSDQLGNGNVLIEKLENHRRIKFVIISCHGLVAHLFTANEHSREAQNIMLDMKESTKAVNASTFVGAGIIKRDRKPQWDSDSCLLDFGYDRPTENPDAILDEFKQDFLLFLSKFQEAHP